LFQGDLLSAGNYTTLIGANDYTDKGKPVDFQLVILLLEMVVQ
jgi:hypothetical protein